MNLPLSSLGLIRAYWKLGLAVILGALICWPVASCSGRRSADARNADKIIAASAKVTVAAAKAELAATAADALRRAKTKEEIDELREIVEQAPAGADAGPAVVGVLERLRKADLR